MREVTLTRLAVREALDPATGSRNLGDAQQSQVRLQINDTLRPSRLDGPIGVRNYHIALDVLTR